MNDKTFNLPPTEMQNWLPADNGINLEDRKFAEELILRTLGVDPNRALIDFSTSLAEATQSLPRYKLAEEKLRETGQENFAIELFKLMNRGSDDIQSDTDLPSDGVLITSMRQGILECAGRTLIASTLLQKHRIKHTPVSAPGHAFLIIEQGPETLIYFDANNNLFFTFPRSALTGYLGPDESSECSLVKFEPRETDVLYGIGTPYSHFVAMPAEEAVGRQYLDNVAAALNGNKEFETSDIAVDRAACSTIHRLASEYYGENKVLRRFNEEIEKLCIEEEKHTLEVRNRVYQLFQSNPDKEKFVNLFLTEFLASNIGSRIPYIVEATVERRRKYAEDVWDHISERIAEEAVADDDRIERT